jgi:hypothetical protein
VRACDTCRFWALSPEQWQHRAAEHHPSCPEFAHVGQLDPLSFAFFTAVGALSKWFGDVEGQAIGELISAIRAAQIQVNAAGEIAKGIPPSATDEERARILAVCKQMVDTAKLNVLNAARHVATAVPAEVLEAFDHVSETIAAAAGAVAEQAKSFGFGVVVLALAFLYFWGGGSRGS